MCAYQKPCFLDVVLTPLFLCLQGNHQFLGPNTSSSFTDTNKPFEVTYGTGHVSGDIVTDDVSIAGLALKAHTFGVANTESVDFSSDTVPFDGLMGLAQSVCPIVPVPASKSCQTEDDLCRPSRTRVSPPP